MPKYQRKRVSKKKQYKKKPVYSKKVTKKVTRRSKFKKRSINRSAIKQGTGHWMSYGSPLFGKRMPKIYKSIPLNTFVKTYSDAITTASSQQSAVTVGSNQLNLFCTMNLSVIASIATDNQYNRFELDTAASLSTLGQPLANAPHISSMKCFVEEYVHKLFYTNQSNAPLTMELYELVARRDMVQANTPYALWVSGNTLLADTGVGSRFAPIYYGMSPFTSTELTTCYKIKRITTIRLAAGETGEHCTRHKPSWLYDESQFEANQTVDFLKGKTHWLLPIVRGCPSDPSNATTVGSAPVQVDFIATHEIHYRFINPGPSRLTGITNAISSAANQRITVVGSGVSTVVTNA